MQNLVEFLKNKITSETSLSGIVDVFEEMCQIPLDEDCLLFEIGTYTFTGKPQFYFSLVRQIPHEDEEDDEYYQIHVNVLYPPSDTVKKLMNQAIFEKFYISNGPEDEFDVKVTFKAP